MNCCSELAWQLLVEAQSVLQRADKTHRKSQRVEENFLACKRAPKSTSSPSPPVRRPPRRTLRFEGFSRSQTAFQVDQPEWNSRPAQRMDAPPPQTRLRWPKASLEPTIAARYRVELIPAPAGRQREMTALKNFARQITIGGWPCFNARSAHRPSKCANIGTV